MTVNYVYLGYGTTDENGVAKLDHDANGDAISHSYTGTGAGEVDVVASLDSTISSGSLVSEPYTITDCGFYDVGTNATHSTKYVNTGVTVNYDTDNVEGTTLTNSNTNNRYYLAYDPSTTKTSASQTYDWSTPCKVECEIISVTGNVELYVDGSITAHQSISTIGSFSKEIPSTVGTASIGFRLPSNAVLKFKGFRIYPI